MPNQHTIPAPIQNTGVSSGSKAIGINPSVQTFTRLCETHARIFEVQALLEALIEKSLNDKSDNDVYSALSGLKRLVQGIGEQLEQTEHAVSDLEQHLRHQTTQAQGATV